MAQNDFVWFLNFNRQVESQKETKARASKFIELLNNNVAESLKYAYNEIGGTGFCKCYLQEFTIPYPEF